MRTLARQERALRPVWPWLGAAALLAYGAALAWYMLTSFDLVNLLRDVNNDDAFYYYQIARNLAAGKFSTFDGGITQTNGYHPIWMLLVTPFYWVFDREAALFGIKAFEVMLIAGGGALVMLTAWLCRQPWILLLVALPLLYQQPALIWETEVVEAKTTFALLRGMEAAAALFMLGLLFLALGLYARSPARRYSWLLAVVAFSLPWVRLEFVAISLAATAALALIEWSWQDKPAGASLRTKMRSTPLRVYVPLIGACLGILVYFAYNRLVFGGILPVSAASKRVWSQAKWEEEGGYSLARNFNEALQIPVFDGELLVALALCAALPLAWWLARRSRGREDWLLLAFLVGVFGLAAGHLAKFAQTVLLVHPRWGQSEWYFVPAYLMMALAIPTAGYVVVHCIRRFVGPKSGGAAGILSLGVVTSVAVFLFLEADFARPFRFVDEAGKSADREWEMTSYLGVQVMNRGLPDDSVIGSWDAGVTGYFSRFPVVNLDGLMNTYDYMRARREANPIFFYQKYGITHFANVWHNSWKNSNLILTGTSYGDDEDYRRVFFLWHSPWSVNLPETPTGDLEYADRFWERMSPHFSYNAGGVAVMVHGTLAQAFVRDCYPEGLENEELVFSWFDEGSGRTANATYRWQDAKVNRLGFCVEAFELPNDAAHPVWVEAAGEYEDWVVKNRPLEVGHRWDIYFNNSQTIYIKSDCQPASTAATFSLHWYPVDVADLPKFRKPHGYGVIDFDFAEYGRRIDGQCALAVPLPDYAITGIRTGQFRREENGNFVWFWRERLPIEHP